MVPYTTILRGTVTVTDNTEKCTDFRILVCTVYAASLFTLAPLRLMPEAQDSYSESSYSGAESLAIESEK